MALEHVPPRSTAATTEAPSATETQTDLERLRREYAKGCATFGRAMPMPPELAASSNTKQDATS